MTSRDWTLFRGVIIGAAAGIVITIIGLWAIGTWAQ